MKILREFDPWKSKLCTCPRKYSLSPYTGCSYHCRYCYITSYIPNAFNCRAKNSLIKNLASDLKIADKNLLISISNSSDPYPQLEEKQKLTREVLKLLKINDFKFQIVTKSDLVVRDTDILKSAKAGVSMTITTIDEKIAKELEPNAPLPEKRIKALEKLVQNKIPCIVRIDPIIPKVNEEQKSLVKKLAEIGVLSITSSTFKARYDSLKRVENAFSRQKISKLYKEGERFGRAIYLERNLRYNLMKSIKELVEEQNMYFACCREGFLELQTAKSCDGTHTISSKG